MSAATPRVPAGVTTGGQFAAAPRAEADDVDLLAEPEVWEPSEGIVVGGDGYASHGDCDPDDAIPGFFPDDDNDCWICGDPLE